MLILMLVSATLIPGCGGKSGETKKATESTITESVTTSKSPQSASFEGITITAENYETPNVLTCSDGSIPGKWVISTVTIQNGDTGLTIGGRQNDSHLALPDMQIENELFGFRTYSGSIVQEGQGWQESAYLDKLGNSDETVPAGGTWKGQFRSMLGEPGVGPNMSKAKWEFRVGYNDRGINTGEVLGSIDMSKVPEK